MTAAVTSRSFLGTGRRLFLAFALLVSTFAIATWFTLSQVREIRSGLADMKRHEEGVRIALELASAVRDQYAHQAHTIILGNATHLPMYDEAEARVKRLTDQVRAHAVNADERGWVADIERSTAGLDEIFRRRIVPAVLRRDKEGVQAEHDRAQVVVTFIQERTDRLAHRFEAAIAAFRSEVGALQAATFRFTLFFLVGAPLLAAVVGAYVLRSVARPVERLRAGAERLASGDLAARIDLDTPDEFGALARQMNAMAASLAEHQDRLVQSEKLAGIGRLAAGVAHEINNPLAVILGYANLLHRRADAATARDLQVIEDETWRAKLIVDGLLELSRPLGAEPEPLDLRALCLEAVARLRETRLLDGVEVVVSGEAHLRGQPHKLRQVVMNLVRNAAEAAGPGGELAVSVAQVPAGAVLVVSDSGPGLPAEARARLFEPFFTTKPSGTGLGLAVSQGIVHAHGGEIEASSPSGGGTVVTVRLPAVPPGRV